MNQKPFRQQINPTPSINPAYWGLMLGGLVRVPLMLSYADLLRLPAVEQLCAVLCSAAQNIQVESWRGVRAQTLLDAVSLLPNAQHAHLFAADGYSTSISLERLAGALLAYARGGEALTPEDGFPVRLVAPGLYGYKMPKWIQRIVLAESPLMGTWERRGWSASGVVQTTAAITYPRHLEPVSGVVTLAGSAYAGGHPITGIEISIDGAPWMPVSFTLAGQFDTTRWSIDWMPPAPGDYRVHARASDGSSTSPTHAVTVRVVETVP